MSILLCSTRKQVVDRWKELLADEYELYEAQSLEHLHSLCFQFKVRVLLLDGTMVSWQQLKKLCQQEMKVKIFFFSDRPGNQQGAAAIACGCMGYGNTYMEITRLQTAIETLDHGKVWLGQNLKQYIFFQKN